MSEEKTHYSKEELVEFKDIILKKLAEAKDEETYLRDSLNSTAELAAEGFNATEFGSEMADKEQAEMLLARTLKFKDALERALVRIENGTYGRCKVTGKLIPKERLRIVPHTESSIEGKNV